jgi:hypothetical protein
MKQLMCSFLFSITIISQAKLRSDEPFQSGPAIGERPKPFSVIAVTGSRRGQTHCYVCEAEDRPVAIVFARTTSGPVTNLIKKLDEALSIHQSAELRSWVVFLAEGRGTLEPKIEQLARQNSVATLPLTLVEDRDGPPAYRIHRDAEVTVLFSVKQKLVASHAFKANELTDARVADVMSSLAKIVSKE